MDDVDVVVIGAGLAGLRCAGLLRRAGLEVTVLEAGEEVGGRVRTDSVDGFLLDRGFQVLNPAYSALRAAVDVDGLRLRRFPAGVRVRTDDGIRTMADPLRAPTLLAPTASTVLPHAAELAGLTRWAAPLLTGLHKEHGLAAHLRRARADEPLRRSLDRAGAHGLLRAVLQRYLAGVILEDAGETSTAFVLMLLRSFIRAAPGLPEAGMHALPRALATPLAGRIRLGEPAQRLERSEGGVRVTAGAGTVRGRRVVVATDAWTAHSLLDAALPAPAAKGVVTDWYAVDTPPEGSGILHLDVRTGGGPVVNTCVVSAVAPSYAPPGRHLVQATTLLPAGADPVAEAEVRRHAADLLGTSPTGWEPIRRHVIPHALPAEPAPLRVRKRQQVDEVTWVCGDHRDTGSIQGALVSGTRAAGAVLASLHRAAA